jgi:Galactose oxidase, central domain
MILGNMQRLATVRTLVSTTLFAIAFAAITPFPLLAQSGTWTNTGSLNTPRTAHTATLLASGQVLVVGGEDSGNNFLTSAELYNPVTGKWAATGSTATRRMDHTATLLPNGEVLVSGGYLGVDPHYQPIYTATAELYDPSSGTWKATGSMTVPRAWHGATLLPNGQVLVAGGTNATTSAELYDPSKGTWTTTGSLPNFHLFALMLLQDGRALAVDESDSSYTPGQLYDRSTGQWTATTNMYYSHSGVSTALLPNGDALVYGNKFSCYAAEFYNPSANTWSRTLGQCGNAISFGPLALLGTGKVLIAGGTVKYSGKSFPTDNCDLYDPSTNRWTATGSLMQSVRHSATRLLNGQVLAVGGSDAELYTP